jgi:4-hydroxy-tetrahydrodipicolinate reductase
MPTNLCVVGATGKFGRSIISLTDPNIKVTGAVSSDTNPLVGRPLTEIGVKNSTVPITKASEIEKAAANSDVVLFVSTPVSDLNNIPKIIQLKKRIVVGTTGFDPTQYEKLRLMLKEVPSVLASNFAVGANILFRIAKLLSSFNDIYDYSIVEQHHKMKSDAPSGTAKTIHEILNSQTSFPRVVTDRTMKPKRERGEIEILSLRGGGTPGIHQLILAGDYERIVVEHLAFSRAASATGALIACKWIAQKMSPGIYSMQDVLNLNDPKTAN